MQVHIECLHVVNFIYSIEFTNTCVSDSFHIITLDYRVRLMYRYLQYWDTDKITLAYKHKMFQIVTIDYDMSLHGVSYRVNEEQHHE